MDANERKWGREEGESKIKWGGRGWGRLRRMGEAMVVGR